MTEQMDGLVTERTMSGDRKTQAQILMLSLICWVATKKLSYTSEPVSSSVTQEMLLTF